MFLNYVNYSPEVHIPIVGNSGRPIQGKSSESVQRHRPSAKRTVPIRKICPIQTRSIALSYQNWSTLYLL